MSSAKENRYDKTSAIYHAQHGIVKVVEKDYLGIQRVKFVIRGESSRVSGGTKIRGVR